MQSTVYTGIPGYALGVLWLLCGILYALYLLVTKFCFKSHDKRKLRKRSLHSRQYYIWPVLLAVFFAILSMLVYLFSYNIYIFLVSKISIFDELPLLTFVELDVG